MTDAYLGQIGNKFRVSLIGRYAKDCDTHEEAEKIYKELNKDLNKLTFTQIQTKYVGNILKEL